jgi:hypothetical protein
LVAENRVFPDLIGSNGLRFHRGGEGASDRCLLCGCGGGSAVAAVIAIMVIMIDGSAIGESEDAHEGEAGGQEFVYNVGFHGWFICLFQ